MAGPGAARTPARRWLLPLGLAAACQVDAPDLGGYQFACDDSAAGACPSGQVCQDGLCVSTPAGDAGDPDAASDPSLIAHLPLDVIDGDLTPDIVGPHEASCSAGACPVPEGGKIGGALSFDGVDDGMALSSPAGLNPPAGTLSVWLYLPAHPTGGATWSVVGKAYGGDVENSYELYVNADGHAVLYSTAAEIAAPAPLPLATWTHLAATWGEDTLRLFVAGEEVGSAAGTPMFDGSPVLLGMDRNDGSSDSFLPGRLDDLRIHDRALSPGEIAALAE